MIYIGCYLVATLPSRKIDIYAPCPKCGLTSNTPFCPFDGSASPTLLVDQPIHLDEIFENVDDSGNEMFTEWKNNDMVPPIFTIGREESIIMVSPYQRWITHKHFSFVNDYRIGGNSINKSPQENFDIDNWPLLFDALSEQQIPFTKRFGVINLEEPFDSMLY